MAASVDDKWLVKENDTIDLIASNSNVIAKLGSAYADKNSRIERIVQYNNIVSSSRLVLGQTILIPGPDKKATVKTATSKPTVLVAGKLSTSLNTYYVSWIWTKQDKTTKDPQLLEYDIEWYYATVVDVENPKNTVWYLADRQVEKYFEFKESRYELPQSLSSAVALKVRIKPIAKFKSDGKTRYWTASWSDDSIISCSYVVVDPPSAPNISLIDNTLTIRMDNVPNDVDYVYFDIWKYDEKAGSKQYTGATLFVNSVRTVVYTATVESGTAYRARAKISKGQANWSDYSEFTDTVYAKPIYPTGVTAAGRDDKTSVEVSWNSVESATDYEIEYSNDPSLFGKNNVTTITNVGKVTSYVITGLVTGNTYYFRVRAVNSGGKSNWPPDYVTVILGRKPNAPTTWTLVSVVDVNTPITLYWVHNSLDASREKQAEIRYSINGVQQEIITVPNTRPKEDKETISSYIFPTPSYIYGTRGGRITWSVRTCGISNEYSDWSIEREFNVYPFPTAGVSVTESVMTQYPLIINCVGDQGVALPMSYHISIISKSRYENSDEFGNKIVIAEGQEIFARDYDTSETSLTIVLGAGDIELYDGMDYIVELTVVFTSGSSGMARSQVFSTSFDSFDFSVDAEIEYNSENYSMAIRPYTETLDFEGNYYTNEMPALISVYRKEQDGSFTEILKESPNYIIKEDNSYEAADIHVIDPHPSLAIARYRVVAKSIETGFTTFEDLEPYEVNFPNIVIQWAEDTGAYENDNNWLGSMVILPYNIDTSDSYDIDVSTVKYMGRKNPVSYYGTQIGQTASWSTDVIKEDTETIDTLRRLSVWMGDVYVREPSGTGYWATIKVSFTNTHAELIIPVKIEVTRVEGGM